MCINMLFVSKPEDFHSNMRVSGCFCEVDGKILLLFRHREKSEGEMWCCPGGKAEEHETTSEAMVRELFEETGIQTLESDIRFFKTVFVRYPETDMEYSIFSLSLPETPLISLKEDEHTQFQWVSPQEALSLPLIPDEDTCIKMFYNL